MLFAVFVHKYDLFMEYNKTGERETACRAPLAAAQREVPALL